MKGELFLYGSGCGFESGDLTSPNVVLLLGGLGGGLMSLSYAPFLSEFLGLHGVSLVQMEMRSSYSAYGYHSLSDDVRDIAEAVQYLVQKREKKKILLLGHSTGCQDILTLCAQASQYAPIFEAVVGGILQGPVSDRDFAFSGSAAGTNGSMLKWAKNAAAPEAIHPVSYEKRHEPLSAARIISLYDRMGDDDFFSVDLTKEELQAKMPSSPFPLMAIFSAQDEYFPYKDKVSSYLQNIQEAWPMLIRTVVLDGADHGVSERKHQVEMCASILEFAKIVKLV